MKNNNNNINNNNNNNTWAIWTHNQKASNSNTLLSVLGLIAGKELGRSQRNGGFLSSIAIAIKRERERILIKLWCDITELLGLLSKEAVHINLLLVSGGPSVYALGCHDGLGCGFEPCHWSDGVPDAIEIASPVLGELVALAH
jgi:hypothetical protein